MRDIDILPADASTARSSRLPEALRKHFRLFDDHIARSPLADRSTAQGRLPIIPPSIVVRARLDSRGPPDPPRREAIVFHVKAFRVEIATLTMILGILGSELWILACH